MEIINNPTFIQNKIILEKSNNKKIGFVPTMGALHKGHKKLLTQARKENDIVVLSIYVNPTQFNDPLDFQKYPKTWEDDIALANDAQVDYIFAPDQNSLYPDNYRYFIDENKNSQILCGAFRPGHFKGMMTIVLKLFQIIPCHRAYFGEKDFQQLQLIKDMVNSFFIPVQIVSVETVREESGLALSSRNSRLSVEDKKLASQIHLQLSQNKELSSIKKALEDMGFEVEYVEEMWGRKLIAAYLNGVRLIDNVPVK